MERGKGRGTGGEREGEGLVHWHSLENGNRALNNITSYPPSETHPAMVLLSPTVLTLLEGYQT